MNGQNGWNGRNGRNGLWWFTQYGVGVGALKIQNLNLGMLNHMNTPKFSLIKLKFRSKWTFPGGVGGGGGRIIWK